MSFRKLVLLSALVALLGLSLVYGIKYEFTPSNTIAKTSVTQRGSQGWIIHSASPNTQLLVFAYSGDAGGFVQASVRISGQYEQQEFYNDTTGKGTFINVPTTVDFNGTTSTDLQNPLVITLPDYRGNYTVYGTYGSASLQNVIVNLSVNQIGEVILNFGSSPPPPLGHLTVVAVWSDGVARAVQASVTITGPESLNATTHDQYADTQAVFTLQPGVYNVTATYDALTPKNYTVTVTAGGFAEALFWWSVPPS